MVTFAPQSHHGETFFAGKRGFSTCECNHVVPGEICAQCELSAVCGLRIKAPRDSESLKAGVRKNTDVNRNFRVGLEI